MRFAHSFSCRRFPYPFRSLTSARDTPGADAGTLWSPGSPDLLLRVLCHNGPVETQRPSRGTSGYFPRTIVRSTQGAMTDRGLRLVLQTRPGLPAPHLPALYPFGYGAFLFVDPRFCLGLPSAVALLRQTLPLATLRLRQAGYGLCPLFVSKYQASPVSSRALPGTQHDSAPDCEELG